MGDDRDRREDDADLEAHLGQLVEEVLVVVVVDVLFVVVDLLDQAVVGRGELPLDAALVGGGGDRRCGLVVGPVGEDFGPGEFAVLEKRGVLVDDIERVPGGESFFWRGRYEYDLNVAHTEDTQLGVFGEFEPKLSEDAKAADTLFLANIQPDLQRQVRAQCAASRFSALDSMNLWIDTAKDSLLAAIAEVDCLIVNDAEIRQLTGESNLARAARAVMEHGPRAVVAKQGEYGAALFTEESFFALPGFPLDDVRDPTGAGDSFAGGFLGYLDSHDGALDEASLRRAMGVGTVLASFNVE